VQQILDATAPQPPVAEPSAPKLSDPASSQAPAGDGPQGTHRSPGLRALRNLPGLRGLHTTSVAARVAQVGILGVLAVGVVGWVSADKTVTVTVDGQARQVHTYAGNVGSALQRAGIAVGPHDVLTPTAAASLHDHDTVVLRRGRLLHLTIDGQQRDIWVTATSVAEALQQLGLRDSDAYLSASRSRPLGLGDNSLDIRLPHTVQVLADGQVHPAVTTAATVSELLGQLGITLGPTDQISVPLSSLPTEGESIGITRIATSQSAEPTPIPHQVVHQKDPGMPVGTSRIVAPGNDGVLMSTYALTLVNGQVTEKKLLGQAITVQPQQGVIADGAATPVASATSAIGPASSGLNWAGLAKCESGGNPHSVSADGRYYGLYQFSLSTWASVGGSGRPSDASPDEQTSRAQILLNRGGRGQWPVCGKYL
jgi:uncharacterized protein YabE (DUF348 family)